MKKTGFLFVSLTILMSIVGCADSNHSSSTVNSSVSENSHSDVSSEKISEVLSESSEKVVTKEDLANALLELTSNASKYTVKNVQYIPNNDGGSGYTANSVENKVSIFDNGVIVNSLTKSYYSNSGEVGYEDSVEPDYSNANDLFYYEDEGKVVYASMSEWSKMKNVFENDEIHNISMAKSFYSNQIKSISDAITHTDDFFNSFIGTEIVVGMGGSTVVVDTIEDLQEEFVTNIDKSYSYTASAKFPNWGYNSLTMTVHATMEADGSISSYGIVNQENDKTEGKVVSLKYTNYKDIVKETTSSIPAESYPDYDSGEWNVTDNTKKIDLTAIVSDGQVSIAEAVELLRGSYTLLDGVTGFTSLKTSEKDTDYRVETITKLYEGGFVEEKCSQTGHVYSFDADFNKVDEGVKTASYIKQTKYDNDIFTTKYNVNDTDGANFFIANDSIQKSYRDNDGIFSFLDNSFAAQLGYCVVENYNSYTFAYTEDESIAVDSLAYSDGIISATYSVTNWGSTTKYEIVISDKGLEKFVTYAYNWSLDGEEKSVVALSRDSITAFSGEII